MKKFLSLACVYLCFALGMQFFNESKAEAYEVFVFSIIGIDHYVETSSFQRINNNRYYVRINCYPPGGDLCITSYIFFQTSHGWGCSYTTSYPTLGTSIDFQAMVNNDWKAQAVFNVVYSQIESSDREAQRVLEEKQRRQAEEQRRQEEERRRQEEERQRLAEENRRRKEAQFNSFIAQGDNFYSAKNYVAAIQSYDEAKNIDNNSVNKFFSELVKNGDRLNAQGNYPAAFDYYKKAAIMNPSESALDKIFNLFGKSGNIIDEENFCKALNERNPNKAPLQAFLGSFYVQTGEFEKALAPLTKAAEILPDNSEISSVLGATYLATKKYDEAIKHFNNALKLAPKDFTAYYFLGIAYEQKKDYKTAKKYLKQALKIKPNDSDAKEALNRVSKAK